MLKIGGRFFCVSNIVSVYMIVSEVSSEGNGTRTEADLKRMGALSLFRVKERERESGHPALEI